MLIFNLTTQPLNIHGKVITPNGGSVDFPDLTPTARDQHLQASKVIAIGALPEGWKPMTLGKKAVPAGVMKSVGANPRGVTGISVKGRPVTTTATGKTVPVKNSPIFTARQVPKSVPAKR